jgi:hypothetical protein
MKKPFYTFVSLFFLYGFNLTYAGVSSAATGKQQSLRLLNCLNHREETTTNRTLKLQVEAPAGTQLFLTSAGKFWVNGNETASLTVRTDGKIDVDIIIREDIQAIPIDGNQPIGDSPQDGEAAMVFGDIDIQVITVDNISGVFETNSNQSASMQARLFDAWGNEISSTQLHVLQNETQTAAAAIDADPELVVYPNPAPEGVFNLQIRGAKINGLVAVHNALGALVAQLPPGTFAEASEVNLDHLPKGIYYLKVPTTEGELIKKFQITQ